MFEKAKYFETGHPTSPPVLDLFSTWNKKENPTPPIKNSNRIFRFSWGLALCNQQTGTWSSSQHLRIGKIRCPCQTVPVSFMAGFAYFIFKWGREQPVGNVRVATGRRRQRSFRPIGNAAFPTLARSRSICIIHSCLFLRSCSDLERIGQQLLNCSVWLGEAMWQRRPPAPFHPHSTGRRNIPRKCHRVCKWVSNQRLPSSLPSSGRRLICIQGIFANPPAPGLPSSFIQSDWLMMNQSSIQFQYYFHQINIHQFNYWNKSKPFWYKRKRNRYGF